MLFFRSALIVIAITTAAAAPSRNTTYHVGNRILTGSPHSFCVIEGSWANGKPFRYQAWDECPKMRVVGISRAEIQDEESYDENHSISDIPKDTEIIKIENGFSEVLVYLDANDTLREIMISD